LHILTRRYALVPHERPRKCGIAEVLPGDRHGPKGRRRSPIKPSVLTWACRRLHTHCTPPASLLHYSALDHPNSSDPRFWCMTNIPEGRDFVSEWLEALALRSRRKDRVCAGWATFLLLYRAADLGRACLRARYWVVHRRSQPQKQSLRVRWDDQGSGLESRLTPLIAPGSPAGFPVPNPTRRLKWTMVSTRDPRRLRFAGSRACGSRHGPLV